MTLLPGVMKQMNGFFYLGNLLMLLSLLGFAYILYPVFRVYVFPPPLSSEYSMVGSSLIIFKIHAEAPIIWNVDPWNSRVYLPALQQGVAHAKGSALPGFPGTVYLFAHSSGMPWDMTRYNTIFLRLGELQKGDPIVVIHSGKQFHYLVREKKEVWPSEVSYLVNNKRSQLVLQTCTPLGTSLRRLLVFADPVH